MPPSFGRMLEAFWYHRRKSSGRGHPGKSQLGDLRVLFLKCMASSAMLFFHLRMRVTKGNSNRLYVFGVSSRAVANNIKEGFS